MHQNLYSKSIAPMVTSSMNATFQLPERAPTDAQLAQSNLRLRIGAHVMDIGALRIISRPDAPRLTSKAVAVLIELIRHAGDTVTRDQLLERVWKDRVTTPDVLTQAIKDLRRAFVDDAKPSRYIETIPKVGYRLIAPVVLVPTAETGLAILPSVSDVAANTQLPLDEFLAESDNGDDGRMFLGYGIAAAVVVLIVGIAALFFSMRDAYVGHAQGVWNAEEVRSITSDPGPERVPRMSPDGTRFVYEKVDIDSSISRIQVRGIMPSNAQTLTARVEDFEASPTWSPDGSEIAFARLRYDSCKIMIAPSTGGSEREVAPCQDYAVNYFDWTPDGKHLISAERVGGDGGDLTLQSWDIATGTKTPLNYEHAANDQDLEAHYSPDGKSIAFRRGLAPYSDLFVMSADGGAVKQVTHINSRIVGYAWTPDSKGLVLSSIVSGESSLYTVAIDGGELSPLGISPATHPSRNRTSSTVLYEIPRFESALTELSVDDPKKVQRLALSTGSDASPAIDPHGGRVVFVSDRSGKQQLWLYDPSLDAASPLTQFQKGVVINPNWSADGKRVLVTHRQDASASLIEIDVESARQRVINRDNENVLSGFYGPDADSFLMTIGPSRSMDHLVYVRHAGAADESRQTLVGAVTHAEIDPVARWVYYTKTAQRGLFRRNLDGGDEEFVTPLITSILTDGWRAVGGKIWYVRDLEINPTDMREFDPATKTDRSVGLFPVELLEVNFSVSQKQDRIIVAPLVRDDTDVGAFDLRNQENL
jgi:Tol biopolymer transport system component/DNA-binding winged helix-turn-helix (wHTH) protein